MTFLLLAGGLAGLVLGGEMLVRGAVAIANRFGIPPLIIGLTLVGFGTSMPELVTSVQAAMIGSPGIAVGNVIGSNIANVLLILGIPAVIAPFSTDPLAFRRDGTVLAAATLICTGLVLYGSFTGLAGASLLAALLAYLVTAYMSGASRSTDEAPTQPAASMVGAALAFSAGLVLTVAGARLLVDGAIDLARMAGVSEAIIGLTIVAVGTSLPELVTSGVAARRGQGGIAFGNVLGSNIFNILGILGITAIVSPLSVPVQIIRFDIWVMCATTVALIWMAISGWRITRREGITLLVGYAAYLGVLASHA